MGTTLQWHRRHAITLVGQLPENTDDALLVLQEARNLVESFLIGVPEEAEDKARAANVLPFGMKGC